MQINRQKKRQWDDLKFSLNYLTFSKLKDLRLHPFYPVFSDLCYGFILRLKYLPQDAF